MYMRSEIFLYRKRITAEESSKLNVHQIGGGGARVGEGTGRSIYAQRYQAAALKTAVIARECCGLRVNCYNTSLHVDVQLKKL